MPIIEEFHSSILGFLRAKDATSLQLWLRVEPPLPDQYYQLGQELRQSYSDSKALEKHIEKLLPESNNGRADGGDTWPGFMAFMKEYLEFWRDVNFDDLLGTHTQLSGVVNSSITAMSNASMGIVILPTTIQLCVALAKLAMTLDKRPDLTRRLRNLENVDQAGESRKSIVEGTAESIQRAFTMCLTERSASRNGIGRDGKPEGKKVGIYKFANLVLKLLFKCRKTRLANQLFTNISQHSPPLALYPASQRVTYLYYLGRFQFSNNHFYQAQLCLQQAYSQCHTRSIGQRRLILIYMIATNLILGRFPSRAFISRPESIGILEKFAPVVKAIRKGDIAAFKRALGPEGGNERWFFEKGLLLALLHRAEVLVWRSLARRVFLLTQQLPIDPNSRKAPTLDLNNVVAAAQYCQKILEGWTPPPKASLFGAKDFSNHNHSHNPNALPAHRGTIFSNLPPTLPEIEAILASLVQQGLLHGFLSHKLGMFAILGAKQRGGALNAGFPPPWEVIRSRAIGNGSNEVPGWVREERRGPIGGVVNLSGVARPVGSGA